MTARTDEREIVIMTDDALRRIADAITKLQLAFRIRGGSWKMPHAGSALAKAAGIPALRIAARPSEAKMVAPTLCAGNVAMSVAVPVISPTRRTKTMGKPTAEGERRIKEWVVATERLKCAKSEVNRAECDVANTRNVLAKWLLPEDAKTGEKIAIWFGDSLIQVEKTKVGDDPIVTIRTRGKSLL